MELSKLVLQRLGDILNRQGLMTIEAKKDCLVLRSAYVELKIVYNIRENSTTLWLGRATDATGQIEIHNEILKEVFKSDLKLAQVSIEAFISGLALFLTREAVPLLNGDLSQMNELERYSRQSAADYTSLLAHQSAMKKADKAWKAKDYKSFVEVLATVDHNKIADSYKLKYKIALSKIKGD